LKTKNEDLISKLTKIAESNILETSERAKLYEKESVMSDVINELEKSKI